MGEKKKKWGEKIRASTCTQRIFELCAGLGHDTNSAAALHNPAHPTPK